MIKKDKKQIIITTSFISDIKDIIDSSRNKAVQSVEFYRVQMYWLLGERIFNEEQGGKDRAEYGSIDILDLHTNISKDELEDKNVLFQQDDKNSYIGKMFNKILEVYMKLLNLIKKFNTLIF